MKFSLLGLGDSNYQKFLGAPKYLRGKLLELGAEEFYAFGAADASRGQEEAVGWRVRRAE